MRFEGRLKSWNDDRGFGFIEPIQGGEEIFVHIKAFPTGCGRPKVSQALTFELELGPKGKRAKNVQPVRERRQRQPTQAQSVAQWGTATLFALPVFVVVCLVISIAWRPPLWFAGVYFVASVFTFVAYFVDKQAARSNAYRISEATLHVLSLAGGWPGALLAQQFLRHKTTKVEFRQVFWATVLLNVVALVAAASPAGRQFLRSVGGA